MSSAGDVDSEANVNGVVEKNGKNDFAKSDDIQKVNKEDDRQNGGVDGTNEVSYLQTEGNGNEKMSDIVNVGDKVECAETSGLIENGVSEENKILDAVSKTEIQVNTNSLTDKQSDTSSSGSGSSYTGSSEESDDEKSVTSETNKTNDKAAENGSATGAVDPSVNEGGQPNENKPSNVRETEVEANVEKVVQESDAKVQASDAKHQNGFDENGVLEAGEVANSASKSQTEETVKPPTDNNDSSTPGAGDTHTEPSEEKLVKTETSQTINHSTENDKTETREHSTENDSVTKSIGRSVNSECQHTDDKHIRDDVKGTDDEMAKDKVDETTDAKHTELPIAATVEQKAEEEENARPEAIGCSVDSESQHSDDKHIRDDVNGTDDEMAKDKVNETTDAKHTELPINATVEQKTEEEENARPDAENVEKRTDEILPPKTEMDSHSTDDNEPQDIIAESKLEPEKENSSENVSPEDKEGYSESTTKDVSHSKASIDKDSSADHKDPAPNGTPKETDIIEEKKTEVTDSDKKLNEQLENSKDILENDNASSTNSEQTDLTSQKTDTVNSVEESEQQDIDKQTEKTVPIPGSFDQDEKGKDETSRTNVRQTEATPDLRETSNISEHGETVNNITGEVSVEQKAEIKHNVEYNGSADKSTKEIINGENSPTEGQQTEESGYDTGATNHKYEKDVEMETRTIDEESTKNECIVPQESVIRDEDADKTDVKSDEESANTPAEPEVVPECELVKRNFDIEECFPALDEVEHTMTALLDKVKSVTEAYSHRITKNTLRDFVSDLGEYNGDFVSIKETYRKCEAFTASLAHTLKELRQSTDEVNSLIGKKFRSEDLAAWLELDASVEQENFTLQEERKAQHKAGLARAAEARAAICQASTAVAEAVQLAAEAETEAIEAQNVARETRECAEAALRAAEDARIAAQEKKKAEEEAKQKALERARIKAEAEKLKREEEERLLAEEAKKKGTTLADEKKRAEEEKIRLENERKNPKNWPRYIYSVEDGKLSGDIGCIIRAIDGSLSQNDVECRCVDQLSGILTLESNEELISNIIELFPVGHNETVRFEEPISLSLPHCLTRTVPGREPVIKAFGENKTWREITTSDVFFEDIKDIRFVEGKISSLGLFVVVLRLKKDRFMFCRSGNKVTSNSDSRISMTCKPGTFRLNINFQLEVQTVDMATINELRNRKELDCNELLATSPIIRFSIPNRTLQKSLIISLPLQQNPSKPKRPSTAVRRETLDPPGERPASARPLSAVSGSKKEEENEEILHLVTREKHSLWTKVQDTNFTHVKHKDMVIFEISHPYSRFMLLRTKSGVGTAKAEKIATSVENALLQHSMQVILRQSNTNALNILVTCIPACKLIKTLARLAAEGYNDGPDATKPIMVREGQMMDIKFRGNVACTNEEDVVLKLVYNSFIKNRTCFQVEEIEKYAQKSFACYLGFAQIFTRGMVVKTTPELDKSKSGSSQKNVKQEMIEEDILLTELLITVPKPDPEPPKPLNTAPVVLSSEGPVTTNSLQAIARKLGEEWVKLAHYLGVKPMRIQSILRQNFSSDSTQARFDMLLTWAKRVPRSMDKSEILSKALVHCGRVDLADEVRGQNHIFRQVRVASAKDSSLRRAFSLIAQDNTVVKDWRKVGEGLGLPGLELDNFEETGSSERERCVLCLKRWRELNDHQANVEWLCQTLNACSYCELANEIKIHR